MDSYAIMRPPVDSIWLMKSAGWSESRISEKREQIYFWKFHKYVQKNDKNDFNVNVAFILTECAARFVIAFHCPMNMKAIERSVSGIEVNKESNQTQSYRLCSRS